MTIIERQNRIIKSVLSTENEELLKKVENLLSRIEIIGFGTDGKPIYEEDFIREIDDIIQKIDSDKDEGIPHETVIQRIKDAYNLD